MREGTQNGAGVTSLPVVRNMDNRALPGSRALAVAARCDDCAAPHPQPGLDVVLICDKGSALDPEYRFQMLLRVVCDLGHKVHRAELQHGQIRLEIGHIQIELGTAALAPGDGPVFVRPADAPPARNAARLGFVAHRYADRLHLRIVGAASDTGLLDLCRVTARCLSPIAAIVQPGSVVLTRTEFRDWLAAGRPTLVPGQVLPRPRARYPRPRGRGTVSPFTSPRHATRYVDMIVKDTQSTRDAARLAQALRDPAPVQGRADVLPRWLATVVIVACIGLGVWLGLGTGVMG